jgi:tetratricopeptide (TPR) repeat protein
MDDAAHAFFQASDLTPSDPMPLTFLGKACDGASPDVAVQIRSRLQSFIGHDSRHAQLSYYLAVCLWKSNSIESNPGLAGQIESLLRRAITLDANYSDAYFQLGNLFAEQHKYKEAVEQYERTLKTNANSANLHYRLGQALARDGNQARAQEEFAMFERLRKSESDATNKEQNQIQQFVYTMRDSDKNQQ